MSEKDLIQDLEERTGLDIREMINERIKKVEVERKLMEFVDYQMICDIDCKTFDVIYNYFLENDVDLSEDLFAKTAIYNLVAYASGFFGGVRIK